MTAIKKHPTKNPDVEYCWVRNSNGVKKLKLFDKKCGGQELTRRTDGCLVHEPGSDCGSVYFGDSVFPREGLPDLD